MWHEARRQEKKIRGIMVDYKRRADRRREFYEKIKQDPAQFLRMYGRPVKIHLDPAVAMAAEGPQSMMPWQGDTNNMIDRFDVRANLDLIPEHTSDRLSGYVDSNDDEERQANYERYRTLVENEAAGLSEEHCLHQIYLDEHFGTINRGNEDEKKKNADKKAAIGFVYEDSTQPDKGENDSEDEESEDDLETADLDVTIDVDTLTPDQVKEVNMCAAQYGMKDDDFSRLLRKDKEELEALREAKQLEEAKAQFSGRKSRRERRAINEKRQNPQRFSRPSYAARESPKYEPYKRPGSSSRSRSRSRSRSSEVAPVTFITSFGTDSDNDGVVQGPALPATHKPAANKKTSTPEPSKCETPWLARRSSSRNERSKSNRSSSRSRSRTRSRSRGRRRSSSSKSSRSWSRSRSRSKSISRSRSRSRSRTRRSSSRRKGSNGRGSISRSRRRRSRSSSSSVPRSGSRSRSRSPPTKSYKRSASPSKKPVIKRYRRESLSSNSGLSDLMSDEDMEKSNSTSTKSSRHGTSSKSDSSKTGKISSKLLHLQSSGPRQTPQERLKKRMQAQLSRQFKADKKAQISKITKQEQERMDREEEIRTMALEMRRREREKRHKEREEEEKERQSRRQNRHSGHSSDSSNSESERSRSSSDSSPVKSRSPPISPEKKRDEKGKPVSGKVESKDEGRKDERRREPPPPPPSSSENKRRSDERKWDGRREYSRWDGDSGRGGQGRGPRSGRESDRWDGPPSRDPRWESDRRERGSDQRMWEGGPRDRGDGHWQSRPPRHSHYNPRSRPPLLQRPGSPLMSRPRPPNDPNLMDEPMDFD